jgi:hypothetical protein
MGVGAEALGNGAGWGALKGPQDHDQGQGEAEGSMEEGRELGMIVGGGGARTWLGGTRVMASWVGCWLPWGSFVFVAAPHPGRWPGL